MKKNTILVVDSDLLRGKVLTEELKLQGFHCLQAMQIPQAEDFLVSLRPACVVLILGELSQVGEYIYKNHMQAPVQEDTHCILISHLGFQTLRVSDRVLDRSLPLSVLKQQVSQACREMMGDQQRVRSERSSGSTRTVHDTSPSSPSQPLSEFRLSSQTGMPPVSNKSSVPGMTNEIRAAGEAVPNLTEEFFQSRSNVMRSGVKSHHKATMELSSLRALSLDDADAEARRRPVLLWGQEEAQGPASGTHSAAEFETSIDSKYVDALTLDYFELLGLSPAASAHEIRMAYQGLKRNFSEERFPPMVLDSRRQQIEEINQTLQEAYEVLSEPKLREMYVRHLQQR